MNDCVSPQYLIQHSRQPYRRPNQLQLNHRDVRTGIGRIEIVAGGEVIRI